MGYQKFDRLESQAGAVILTAVESQSSVAIIEPKLDCQAKRSFTPLLGKRRVQPAIGSELGGSRVSDGEDQQLPAA